MQHTPTCSTKLWGTRKAILGTLLFSEFVPYIASIQGIQNVSRAFWGAMGSFGTLWDAIGLLLALLGAAFGSLWDALGRPWALVGSL